MPDDLGLWEAADWQAFIDSRSRQSDPSTVRNVVCAVRALITFSPVLTGVPTLVDPWPGKSNAQVAESVWTDELSTPAIPPEVWWPLLRASWAYIDRFPRTSWPTAISASPNQSAGRHRGRTATARSINGWQIRPPASRSTHKTEAARVAAR